MRIFLFFFCFYLSFHVSAQAKDTLLVGYTSAPPFIIQEEDHLEGINIYLWQRCAKELDLPYKLIPMNFREMLDSLRAGDIDISINPLTVTSERMNQFAFTQTFYASHSIIVKEKMSGFQKFNQLIVSLLSPEFLSGFLVLLGIIALFGGLAWYFEHEVNPQGFRKGLPGLWDGLWWSVVTMTTVGYGDKAPKSSGGKVVALIWMFSGLLFISGITASIASTLTLNSLSSDTRALQDFSDKTVGTIQYSSSESCLQENYFSDVVAYNGVNEGLEALQTKDIEAFFYDEPILKYRISQEKKFKGLEILPGKYRTQFYAFGLAKQQVSLIEPLSQKIMDITERSEWQSTLKRYGLE